MFSRTTIAIAAVSVLAAIATVYIYWTRTPQYALLHVLDVFAKADLDRMPLYISKESSRIKNSHQVPRQTKGLIQHLTGLQNETIARAYCVTVEDSRIDGKAATLRVKVGDVSYQLRFEEQIDGRWTLMDFEDRQAFSERAIKGMKPITLCSLRDYRSPMLMLKANRLGTTARVPVCYPVMFQTDWYMDEGNVLDLSLPGCAIESSRCLIPDEYVRLQVLVPQKAVYVEVAKVRWAERNRFGLEFLKMPQDDKERLLGVVRDFYA